MTKLLRMLSMHPYYQNGRMYVNELLKSNPDIAVGLKQLYAVEPGMTEHDDSPDADEQAVKKLEIYTDPHNQRMNPRHDRGKREDINVNTLGNYEVHQHG